MSGNNKQSMPQEDEQPTLDNLQAGLFFLMNQYTFHQSPKIAEKIVEHLNLLCNHPHIALLPTQNHLYARLLNIWRARQPVAGISPRSETVH